MLKLDVDFPILKCWRNRSIFSIPSYCHGTITKLIETKDTDPGFLPGKTYREVQNGSNCIQTDGSDHHLSLTWAGPQALQLKCEYALQEYLH